MNRVSRIRRVALWLALNAIAVPALADADFSTEPLDTIRAAAQAYVQKQIPQREPGSVQVKAGPLDPRLRLAACGAPLRAALPTGASIREQMTVAVSCPSGTLWTVYIPVTVETHTSVLVLRHAAARGARLSAADVEVQTRTVGGPGDSYLTEVAELSARTLKRPLAAGAALFADAMVDDVLVHRGQTVNLVAAVGGLEVRATGLALADARLADRIKVQNSTSQRVVEGVVETADVIRITP